jgi:hypothetical protein
MKRFQFSLSAVFVAMVFAWAFISVLMQFVSFGAEAAFEQLLWLVWLASLLISFWRSTARGWKRILQATMLTGAVWSTIVCTYLLLSIPLGIYDETFVTGVSSLGLLLHALAVAVAGVAAGFLGACLLQMVVWAAHRWRSAARGTRVVCFAAMLSIAIAAGLWWHVEHSRLWKPSIAAASDAEPDRARQILHKHGLWVLPAVSPDGRFVAGWNESSINVFDMATSNMIADLRAPEGAHFTTMKFLSDSSALVAILGVPGTTGGVLFRWTTDTWEEEDRLSLDRLPNQSRRGKTFPILTDDTLLLVHMDDADPARAQIELFTAELLKDCRIVKFASTTAKLAMPVDGQRRLPPTHWDWKVAPNHACIVIKVERDCHWVFRRGSDQILKFPGDPLAFFSDGDRIVISEQSWQLIVRSRDKASGYRHAPPLWYPPWDFEICYRVSALDSRTGRRIARSDWWPCRPPAFDPVRRTVTAEYQKGLLVWDVAAVGQDP